jgi:methyltransferase family protein
MAIAIMKSWKTYFDTSRDEGLGSSYERVILNQKLDAIRRQHAVKTVLEAPAFGFTGLSGINSMGLARSGVAVSLLDHDQERAKRIRELWDEIRLPLDAKYVQDFSSLPFKSNTFDMSWNFAAIWFVQDLDLFIAELARVTSKVIVIGVPNRTGLGYWLEKWAAGREISPTVREAHIVPKNIIRSMKAVGWRLIEHTYIDAPPWPDIGMKKEDFLHKLGLGLLVRQSNTSVPSRPLSIMDYYTGADPQFERRMLKYAWWERIAPLFIKFFWAHHRVLQFEPEDK